MVNIVVIIIEIVGTGRRDLRYVLKLLKNCSKIAQKFDETTEPGKIQEKKQ